VGLLDHQIALGVAVSNLGAEVIDQGGVVGGVTAGGKKIMKNVTWH